MKEIHAGHFFPSKYIYKGIGSGIGIFYTAFSYTYRLEVITLITFLKMNCF